MKIINSSINIDGIIIPVEVFKELRMDVRTVMRKDKIIIRLPIYYSKSDIKNTLKNAEKWVHSNFKKNDSLKMNYILKEFQSGDQLNINGETFILDIKEHNINNYRAELNKNIIRIAIPLGAEKHEKKESLVYLQSRIVGQYFLPEIEKRIEELNNKFFKVKINGIRMKYNKTNWGSRSAKSNINISTRLLFAPKDVQDYVFIHELAHFIEMNHSKKFWEIVGNVMPDYREKELWLKKNGSKCDF